MFRGGESQKSKALLNAGYSIKAQCTGKPAYLKPNSNSMQKPIGGLSVLAENVEDRSPIACSANQKHVENYLKGRGYKSKTALARYLRTLHCSTFGQSRHSSGNGAPSGKGFKSPEKCAHFAGESNTFGYSVGFTLVIFMFSVVISSLDMQCGQA